MHRVVVTGIGIIAPVGNSVKDSWNSTANGKSAVGNVSLFDASELPVRIGAEVRQFDAAAFMAAKETRRTSRFIQFTIAASKQAMDDSGLSDRAPNDRFGCIFGVGLGASDDIATQSEILRVEGPRRVSPMLMPTAIPNMAAGFVALQHRLRGVNMCVSTASASGTHAIGEAYMHVTLGTADGIVAGAAESVFTPLIFAAFARMGTSRHAMSRRRPPRGPSTRNETDSSLARPPPPWYSKVLNTRSNVALESMPSSSAMVLQQMPITSPHLLRKVREQRGRCRWP